MIIDPDDYEAEIRVGPSPMVNQWQWEEIGKWAAENNIRYDYAFGTLFFESEEDAVLFKLRFAL